MTGLQRFVIACFLVVALTSFLPHFSAWAASANARFYFFLASFPLQLLSAVASVGFLFLRALPFTVDARAFAKRWSRTSWACFLIIAGFPWLSSLACGQLPFGSQLRSFDPIAWQASSACDTSPSSISIRQQMLGAAVAEIVSPSRRREISAFLGNSELPDKNLPFDTDAGLGYVTGDCREGAFVRGTEWLLIWLSDNGSVLRWQIAGPR